MAVTKIDKYVVQYASNSFSPRIWFRGDGKWIGHALFKPNGSSLPADNEGNLHFHLEEYQHVLDLLRNEEPVYYSYVGSGPGNENSIRTSQEEIGEGEIS